MSSKINRLRAERGKNDEKIAVLRARNNEIDKQITLDTQDYTNNIEAMNEIAGSDYQSAFLGGQNHIALFAEAAPKIDMSNISAYDQGLNESFQKAFKNYFDGNATIDEAKQLFKDDISEKYQELVNFQWPDAE